MPRSKNLNPNLAAFLDMLAYSEGTLKYGKDDGYNVIVGGSLFSSYSSHPKKLIQINSKLKSTAAGRYQIMARYYEPYKLLLHLNDFSPIAQDAIAIQMIREQKAFGPLSVGNIREAIKLCVNIWASLPGAGYGQHENKLENLVDFYKSLGGVDSGL